MSQQISTSATAGDPVTLETGLEALQSSPEFNGPVEDLEGHHCNDHFAQIYESDAERFAAAVPFVRHGLDRDERVMYVIDKSSEAEVKTALRDGGIDVDAAVDTGQLSFHTVQDTYLRNGTFDPDEMIEFYGDTVAEATAEYEALRIVAEMTWLQDHTTAVEQFMEYEAKVNDLFADEDCLAICQYDRNEFPPEIIRDIIQTHPHLIYDGAACHNVYYTPPEEFFGADEPARENNRMLRTLHERATAKAELRERERFLEEFTEITTNPTQSFDAKIRRLLELGTERFDLEIGYVTQTSDDDRFTVVDAVGPTEQLEPDVTDSLCDTYCEKLLASPGKIAVRNAADVGWTNDPAYQTYGLDAFFARTIHVGGEEYGTLCFASKTPRDRPYTDTERAFLDLMGQWLGDQLERHRRERFLRESLRVTADPDIEFEQKLEQLLELGCEQFGLEMAGLNHLPSWDGAFRLEKGVGLDTDGDDLWTDPGDGCFCRQTIEQDEPVSMPDVSGTDWSEDTIHQQFGLTSYLGTKVTSGATPYGTLWFGSTESRDRPFSETEQTLIELMGQWVSYELERREHTEDQQALYRITADPDLETDEKIAELLELGCEQLDLPVGMLTRKRDEAFEITQMRGEHPELDEGTLTPPSTDNYCRRVVDTGSTVTVADAGAAGWDGDALYHEFGLECYAGVQLTVNDEPHGTICFTDLSPRGVAFTEAEETFLELMGQCVSYELERNQREEQLAQKNDRLESFASMLAHELRNPVAIGQIYSQQLPAEADAEAVEYVTDAFDRIEDMVDVMLILTRGREAIDERTSVDLGDVAQRAWDTVDAPDAALETTIDWTIQADETYIQHLFQNLLENAVEHGGSDVTVTVGKLDNGFYVADDGVGIPPGERDAVFDEGYTTATDTGGTGLGLAFVRKLAEVYEWDCTVTDSEAGGARFEFRNVA